MNQPHIPTAMQAHAHALLWNGVMQLIAHPPEAMEGDLRRELIADKLFKAARVVMETEANNK